MDICSPRKCYVYFQVLVMQITQELIWKRQLQTARIKSPLQIETSLIDRK